MVTGYSRNRTIDHPNYCHVEIDLGDLDKVKSLTFEPVISPEKIVLINNSGTLGAVKHIGGVDAETLENACNVNLVAPMIMTNNFIKAYREVEAEKIIISVSSGAAQNPYDGWGPYCTTKAGLEMFARVIATEQEVQNSKCPFKAFSIAPGVVNTQMQDELRESDIAHFSKMQKFVDLKENDHLRPAREVAEKYLEIIEDTSQLPGVVWRVP